MREAMDARVAHRRFQSLRRYKKFAVPRTLRTAIDYFVEKADRFRALQPSDGWRRGRDGIDLGVQSIVSLAHLFDRLVLLAGGRKPDEQVLVFHTEFVRELTHFQAFFAGGFQCC